MSDETMAPMLNALDTASVRRVLAMAAGIQAARDGNAVATTTLRRIADALAP